MIPTDDLLVLDNDDTKRCVHCGQRKHYTEFYRCRSTKDTLQSWCKQCQKEYHEKFPLPRGLRKRNNNKPNLKTIRPMPIIGFEDYTKILNEYEKNILLPRVAAILAHRIGKKNAIRNVAICRQLKAEGFDDTKISEPRMRKIINVIRRTPSFVPFIVANSNGYYIAESKEEVLNYAESLKERATAIFDVRSCLLNDLNGQLFV